MRPFFQRYKSLISYVLKFLLFFCMLYYGTLAIIGLASPGGYYSPFIHDYLNYIGWLRYALLHCSKAILTIFGYNVFVDGTYVVRFHDGHGVHLVYSCVGYGVMSFWIAFILANQVKWQKKIKWIITGVALIFIINVARISLLLVAVNEKWQIFFNMDNHALFNIAAYILIFTMIYFFDRYERVGVK
jgi:exosortase/archaeosortase family protein